MAIKKYVLLVLSFCLLVPQVGMGAKKKKVVSTKLKEEYTNNVQGYLQMLKNRKSLIHLKKIQPIVHRFVDKYIKDFGFKKRMKGFNIQLLPYSTTTPPVFYRGEVGGGTIFMKKKEVNLRESLISTLQAQLENNEDYTKTLNDIFKLYKKRNTGKRRARIEINFYLDVRLGCRYIIDENNKKYDLENEKKNPSKPKKIISVSSFENLTDLLKFLLKKYEQTQDKNEKEKIQRRIYQTLFKILIYLGKVSKKDTKTNRAKLIGQAISNIIISGENKKPDMLTTIPSNFIGFDHPDIKGLKFENLFNTLLSSVGLPKSKPNENTRNENRKNFISELEAMLQKFFNKLEEHLNNNEFDPFKDLYLITKQRIIDCADFFDTIPWHEKLEDLYNRYIQKKKEFEENYEKLMLEKQKEEEEKRQQEIEKRKQEIEKERKRKEEEERKRKEEEKRKQKEIEEKLKKLEEEKKKLKEEKEREKLEKERKRIEEEERKRKEEEERKRKEEEERLRKQQEELKRLEEEAERKRKEDEEKRKQDEVRIKKLEEEKNKKDEAIKKIKLLLNAIKAIIGKIDFNNLTPDTKIPAQGTLEGLLNKIEEFTNKFDSGLPGMDELKQEKRKIKTLLDLHKIKNLKGRDEDILRDLNDIAENDMLKDVIKQTRSKHEKTFLDKLKKLQDNCGRFFKQYITKEAMGQRRKKSEKEAGEKIIQEGKDYLKENVERELLSSITLYSILRDEAIIEWQNTTKKKLYDIVGWPKTETEEEEEEEEDQTVGPRERSA